MLAWPGRTSITAGLDTRRPEKQGEKTRRPGQKATGGGMTLENRFQWTYRTGSRFDKNRTCSLSDICQGWIRCLMSRRLFFGQRENSPNATGNGSGRRSPQWRFRNSRNCLPVAGSSGSIPLFASTQERLRGNGRMTGRLPCSLYPPDIPHEVRTFCRRPVGWAAEPFPRLTFRTLWGFVTISLIRRGRKSILFWVISASVN